MEVDKKTFLLKLFQGANVHCKMPEKKRISLRPRDSIPTRKDRAKFERAKNRLEHRIFKVTRYLRKFFISDQAIMDLAHYHLQKDTGRLSLLKDFEPTPLWLKEFRVKHKLRKRPGNGEIIKNLRTEVKVRDLFATAKTAEAEGFTSTHNIGVYNEEDKKAQPLVLTQRPIPPVQFLDLFKAFLKEPEITEKLEAKSPEKPEKTEITAQPSESTEGFPSSNEGDEDVQEIMGKEVACTITKLPEGTVVFEDIGSEVLKGQILKQIDKTQCPSPTIGTSPRSESSDGRLRYRGPDRQEVRPDHDSNNGRWVVRVERLCLPYVAKLAEDDPKPIDAHDPPSLKESQPIVPRRSGRLAQTFQTPAHPNPAKNSKTTNKRRSEEKNFPSGFFCKDGENANNSTGQRVNRKRGPEENKNDASTTDYAVQSFFQRKRPNAKTSRGPGRTPKTPKTRKTLKTSQNPKTFSKTPNDISIVDSETDVLAEISSEDITLILGDPDEVNPPGPVCDHEIYNVTNFIFRDPSSPSIISDENVCGQVGLGLTVFEALCRDCKEDVEALMSDPNLFCTDDCMEGILGGESDLEVSSENTKNIEKIGANPAPFFDLTKEWSGFEFFTI